MAVYKCLPILFLISFLALYALPSFGIDEESLAQQAEAAGKYREALTLYVNALQSVSERSSKDQELREKIIKLVQKIQPPPVVPEEALRYMALGQAAIESAKNKSDYKDAVTEFKKVANTAPWWADAYYNLGVAQEKTDQYSEAILSLKYYILAAPNASDLQSVQTKIFKLEYKMEKDAKTVNLDGEWTGTVNQPNMPPPTPDYPGLTGEDVYRIEINETRVNIILISTDSVRPYSFFGNYHNQPIGQVIFQLRLDGTRLNGTYFQPFMSQINPAKELAVTGEVANDLNTIVLKFKESIIIKDSVGTIVEAGQFTILTMKRR